MPDRTDAIREIARKWLADGVVEAVVGWEKGTHGNRTAPVLVRSPEQADRLVFNEHCTNNLMTYLKRPVLKGMQKVGIVAKGCDIKSLIGLLQESQVEREKVKILAVTCPGVKKDDGTAPVKCRACDVNTPAFFDERAGDPVPSNPDPKARLEELEKLDAMSPAERHRFWRTEFDKCIRCYACRAACPMCYCQECIADRNLPQWIDAAPRPRGNFAWNFIRAWHLAGRCVQCRACERACPQGITLMLLNRMIADEISQDFGYLAGAGSPEDAAFFAAFKDNDNDAFILGK